MAKRQRQLVDQAEAAAHLDVSPQTLANWRHLGAGPRFYKLGGRGGRVKYDVADLEAFLEASAVEPVASAS